MSERVLLCEVSSPVGSLKGAGQFKCTVQTLHLLWEGSSMCRVSCVLILFLVLFTALF